MTSGSTWQAEVSIAATTSGTAKPFLDSRVQSTAVLHQALRQLGKPPAVWLNASTATIYRHALDRPMDEATGELGGDEPGAPDTWNFSIEVARAWEETFFSTATPGTRQVALRSAMTFSPDRGGVFDVFLALVRHGLGGTNSPGTQFVSWVHEIDFISAVEFLIATPSLAGPINIASPHPLPNAQFLRILRQTWGAHIGIPTSRWMLEVGTFLLRTESELVLKSRRVITISPFCGVRENLRRRIFSTTDCGPPACAAPPSAAGACSASSSSITCPG